MARQLTFDLPAKTALERGDFFVSKVNAQAVAMLENWPEWPAGKLMLVGPAGSGKTHLTHVWAVESDAAILKAETLDEHRILTLRNRAVAIEDVDQIIGDRPAETALFHLHNILTAEARPLLMTSRTAPAHWAFTLPDLTSRVQATAMTKITPPDDALLSAMLVKLFHDRQITVAPAVISYLVSRMERSFTACARLVETLDRAALAERRAITLPFAARILDKSGIAGA